MSAPGEFRTGWRLLAGATMGCALGASSLPSYSFGSFILPLTREFGWSRGQLSFALLLMTLTLAAIAPILGNIIDRLGVRKVALVSVPFLAAIFLALSLSTGALLQVYVAYAAISILAGGTTPINYTRAINHHFDRARGLALGLTLSGMGLAGTLVPIFVTHIISSGGWRAGYQMLALLALIAWPAVYLGLPRRVATATAPVERSAAVERSFYKSRVFLTLAPTCFVVSIALYGMLVHMLPLLIDEGLTPAQAARYAALIGLGSIIGRLTVGFLADRYFAPYVGAGAFVLTAVGCALFAISGTGLAAVAALLVGFSFGAEIDLIAFLVARYFPLRRYGKIYGSIYSCFAVGASCGPAIAGLVFDSTGSYLAAIWGAVAILISCAVSIATLPAFPERESSVA